MSEQILGVACVLYDGNKVLLQHRRKSPGEGLHVLPGGRLEYESPEDGIKRELREELGLDSYVALFPVTHALSIDPDGRRVIMLYFAASLSDKYQLVNREPEKCYGLAWHDRRSLPAGMWATDKNAIYRLYNLDFMSHLS